MPGSAPPMNLEFMLCMSWQIQPRNVRWRTEGIRRAAYSASTTCANGSCPESTMQADMVQAASTSTNAWRVDFARIYAAREQCTSVQGGRVASILCQSLGLLPPLVAVGMVLADDALLAALRMATHEVRGDPLRSTW